MRVTHIASTLTSGDVVRMTTSADESMPAPRARDSVAMDVVREDAADGTAIVGDGDFRGGYRGVMLTRSSPPPTQHRAAASPTPRLR